MRYLTFARSRPLSFLVLSIACVAYGLWAGKDLNWDQINYHFYAGYAALYDRLQQDFLPASVTSYVTPYGYVPFYLLASSGLNDQLVVAVLAVFASVGAWGVWELGGRLGASMKGQSGVDVALAWLGTGFAVICPLFLAQIGTSYLDITTGAVVVWAYAALVGRSVGDRRLLLIAGLLLGLATALKPTNVFFAVAAAALVVDRGSCGGRLRSLFEFAAAGLAGGLVVLAPWAMQLQRAFGNPFFPNLNNVFRSPDFPTDAMAPHVRFIPETLLDAIVRPLWMMSPEAGIYVELPAPDARYFSLFILFAIAVLAFAVSRIAPSRSLSVRTAPQSRLGALTAAFLIAWVAWTAVSGNGRYFMPMALVAGPLIVAWTLQIGGSLRWRFYALSSIALLSLGIVAMGANARFGGAEWTGTWYDVKVPARLLEEPRLVIALDVQSNAYLAPFLHPATSFVSAVGMHALGPDAPGWARIERLMARHGGKVSVLAMVPLGSDGKPVKWTETSARNATARLGLRADLGRCETISSRGLSSAAVVVSGVGSNVSLRLNENATTEYIVCPVQPAPEWLAEFREQVKRPDKAFAALASRCPRLFRPDNTPTLGNVGSWFRIYMGSDMIVTVGDEDVSYTRWGLNSERRVGRIDDIIEGRFDFACDRKRDPVIQMAAG